MSTRTCGTCHEEFEPSEFLKNKEYDCAGCRSDKRAAYRLKNLDHLRAENRAYKRRARIKTLLGRVDELRELLEETDDQLLYLHSKLRRDVERELTGYLNELGEKTAEEIAEAQEWVKKSDKPLPPKVTDWVRRSLKAFERLQAARTPEEIAERQANFEELLKDVPEDEIREMHREERKAYLKASDRKRLGN